MPDPTETPPYTPFDPYRANQNYDQTTQQNWVIRKSGYREENHHNYKAATDLGKDSDPPRWPARPLDKAGFMVILSADRTMSKLTAERYKEYAGILMNPVWQDSYEQVWEKSGEILLPIGSEAVVFNHMVMPDPDPQFGDYGTDVVRQFISKKFEFVAKTAVTAAVNAAAGYAIGDTVVVVDTVEADWGLQVGDTIYFATSGEVNVIKKIEYSDKDNATITLGNPLGAALVNDEVVTTAHAADREIFFDPNGELWANAKTIKNAKILDLSGPSAAVQQIETVDPPTAGVSLPSDGKSIKSHVALETGDVLSCIIEFYDDLIRPFTVGKAVESKSARVSATSYENARIEMKM